MKGEISRIVNQTSKLRKGKNNIISNKPNIKSRHKAKFNEPNSPNRRQRLYQLAGQIHLDAVSNNIPVSDGNDFGSK